MTDGSIAEFVTGKTTLTRFYEITLTGSATWRYKPSFNQKPYPRRHYKIVASVGSQHRSRYSYIKLLTATFCKQFPLVKIHMY